MLFVDAVYMLFALLLGAIGVYQSVCKRGTNYNVKGVYRSERPVPLLGGGPLRSYPLLLLSESLSDVDRASLLARFPKTAKFTFVSHCSAEEADVVAGKDTDVVVCEIHAAIIRKVTRAILNDIMKQHGLSVTERHLLPDAVDFFLSHTCDACSRYRLVFRKIISNAPYDKAQRRTPPERLHPDARRMIVDATAYDCPPVKFPPAPASRQLLDAVVRGWCADIDTASVEEMGCAVCAQLTPISDLRPLVDPGVDLTLLDPARWGLSNITRQERFHSSDPVTELPGPVFDKACSSICSACYTTMAKGSMPRNAIANGMWLGNVPTELSELRFAERQLVARVRHNACLFRVNCGMYRMRANAIMFATPMLKVYKLLPPPREEMDEVLAFLYLGPSQPTNEELKDRVPLFVRRNKVAAALNWLKLNHSDYADLEISRDNLDSYPEDEPVVAIAYYQTDGVGNRDTEGLAVYDDELEDGVDDGICPIAVHGLTGEDLGDLDLPKLKAQAMQHLKSGNKFLAIGRSHIPESLFRNPQLYPKMLPWLFPYGLGGIQNGNGNKQIGMGNWKKHQLMYFDKRFQKDAAYPIIAFNDDQMKTCTRGGMLLSKSSKFSETVNRLLSIDPEELDKLVKRLEAGDYARTDTDQEKMCYKVLDDIDHVAAKVPGSLTGKKNMRSEIWSLMSTFGTPVWYITFAPADNKHPICFYYAGDNATFQPDISLCPDRHRLIVTNPAAGARFFDLTVRLFIKHVLGVDSDHVGIYGKTAAYYGTVEQQGRLTLHLHLLLWIQSSLSPQEIRNRLSEPDGAFEKELIDYLESCHVGELLTGTVNDVKEATRIARSSESAMSTSYPYTNPVETLPIPPPLACSAACGVCSACAEHCAWWIRESTVIDDIIVKSNIHKCGKHCLSNKHGACKARFPRDVVRETTVDQVDGSIKMKHLEAWINTVTPILTYLLRCNSDVTCLLSGTAVKAVVGYITDYVTKVPLKTHAVFDVIKTVFDSKQADLLDEERRLEKSRKLITSVVNSLSAKMEIGSPMACMYLLKNPDHYTSHKFTKFYWRSYVAHVRNALSPDSDATDADQPSLDPQGMPPHDRLVLMRVKEKVVGYSTVLDYVYRPVDFDSMPLYDWVRLVHKNRLSASKGRDSAASTTICGDNIVDCTSAQFDRGCGSDDNGDVVMQEGDEGVEVSPRIEVNETERGDQGSVSAPLEERRGPEVHRRFLPDHPQAHSYSVCIRAEAHALVPDFVCALPRPDLGDREYYCCTMMTLFRPWRDPRDLKKPDVSWDETFVRHAFTDRQKQLMDNFCVRFECHDARDDFRRNMVNSSRPGQSWSAGDDVHDMDDVTLSANNSELLHGESTFNMLHDADQIGRQTLTVHRHMDAMGEILLNCGWSASLGDATRTLPVFDSIVRRESKHWTALLQTAKNAVLEARQRKIRPPKANVHAKHKMNDNAKIINLDYLLKMGFSVPVVDRARISAMTELFTLNEEQERAFRIVSQHAASLDPAQLKMYLGGMGGTGKSQVIKALVRYFTDRDEAHRFIVLAPTGSAAALVGGATYHSFLGIFSVKGKEVKSPKTMAEAKARLTGVEYMFIDEVSMLGCHELYEISARLAVLLEQPASAFGGMNMIFAGDFAQLCPVGGKTLFCRDVGTCVDAGMTVHAQECALGKALWHQVTTVVILRQNMRQKTQSDRDAKLRTALENMRYAACTTDDITFLRSLIPHRVDRNSCLSDLNFHDVSVIVSHNAHRDRVNEIGVRRFAKETGQMVYDFYSVDKPGSALESDKTSGSKQMKNRKRRKETSIDPHLQQILWNLPPCRSSHRAGKLSLCLGLPVMIKYNEATECCVTNGAEAIVYHWDAHEIDGRHFLDVLFVKLVNPPRSIHLAGLPENVVPINCSTEASLLCHLPDDSSMRISRTQVFVLPNFAMTDYAAQGRTRSFNVMDLNNCKNHHSYYTCLSRSSSADGTVILQGFDPKKIMNGIDGFLRQEFRELELLDTITNVRYLGMMPPQVDAHRRNSLFAQYKKHCGIAPSPHLHRSIGWSIANPFRLPPPKAASEWTIVNKDQDKKKRLIAITSQASATASIPADSSCIVESLPSDRALNLKLSSKRSVADLESARATQTAPCETALPAATDNGSVHIDSAVVNHTAPQIAQSKLKRRIPDTDELSTTVPLNKRRIALERRHKGPMGLTWDGANFSCMYDALFVVLYDIWISAPVVWSNKYYNQNKYMKLLADTFRFVSSGTSTLENARDVVRASLHVDDSESFPMGNVYASLERLLIVLLSSPPPSPSLSISMRCINCLDLGPQGVLSPRRYRSESTWIETIAHREWDAFATLQASMGIGPSYSSWVGYLSSFMTSVPCRNCRAPVQGSYIFSRCPGFVGFPVHSNDIQLSRSITVRDGSGDACVLHLRGIFYFASSHFTARIVDSNARVWYSDGIIHRKECAFNGMLHQLSDADLLTYERHAHSLDPTLDGSPFRACAILYSM